MKRAENVIVCFVAAVILAACSGPNAHGPHHTMHAPDSLNLEHMALMIYGTEPDRALSIIDSAKAIGDIPPLNADYLRAKVYAESLVLYQKDTAVAICLELLQNDSLNSGSERSNDFRLNVLHTLAIAYKGLGENENYLKYLIEISELCRAMGMETESTRTDVEIAMTFSTLGRQEEALEKLDEIIRSLSGARSIDKMDVCILALRRKQSIFENQARFDEIPPVARKIIDIINEYRKHPELYAEDSYRLVPDKKDRERFCDFCVSQAYAYLSNGYSRSNPAKLDSARVYYTLFEATPYSQTLSGKKLIAHTWRAIGKWDKLEDVDRIILEKVGKDTLCFEYAQVLRDRAMIAMSKQKYDTSYRYMTRYIKLANYLSEKEHLEEIQGYIQRFAESENALKLQKAETASKRKDTIIAMLVILFIVAAVFTYIFYQKRKTIAEKNQALVRIISNKSEKKVDASSPDQKLFRKIDNAIRGERLYTNTYLQRQDIIDRFGISRHKLNDLLNSFTEGGSFPNYINSIRLEEAVTMLSEEPSMNISSIATAVGFTPTNFREQFKRQYGMTPAEFRQNL